MPTVTIHQAKTSLSKLVARIRAGGEIVIARGKEPVARLSPIVPAHGRKFGAMRGRARIGEAFFEPLPADEIEAWRR